MQFPVMYYLFNECKNENFNTNENRKVPLNVMLYYLVILYISTLITVFATILAWSRANGTLFMKLNYALLGSVLGVFYLMFHYITYGNVSV